jgi:hypothetical protein
MEFIIDKVTEYLNKAISKHAKEKNLAPNDVQILFYLKGDGFAAVKICEHYHAKEEITFKKAMGVKLDLLNFAGATEYFVQQALFDFCSKDEIKQENVSVMIVRKNDEEMSMHLYNEGQHVRKIQPEEIFDQTKLQTS